MQHTHLLTPDKEPMTDQSTNATQVQLGEPRSFTGFTYRNMGEASLTGAEMTQIQLHYPDPPQRGRQLTQLGITAGSSAGWRASFPSDSGLNLFQAALLVSACRSGLRIFAS